MRFLTLAALALALAACGSSSGSSSTPTIADTGTGTTTTSVAPSGRTLDVTMKNLAFLPATVHVKVGDTIRFTNQDTPPHNVTWVSGPRFTSSSTLDTGAGFTLKLTQPGTIHYFCSIHPFMKGTILVTR